MAKPDKFKQWVRAQDFWKSDHTDWQPLWDKLHDAGMSDDEIVEMLDNTVARVAQEYGT